MKKGGVTVAILALTVLASCSSGGGSFGGGASPGHDSPKDAVDGFLSGLENDSASACSYVDPSDQSDCSSGLDLSELKTTGTFSIGNDVVQGNEALVAVTGNFCYNVSGLGTAATGCGDDTNPNTGLPTSGESFQQAYDDAVNNSTANDAAPCIEVDGIWYVNIGSDDNSGSTPTTATTIPSLGGATTLPTSGGETTLPTTPVTTSPTTTPTTIP